MSTMIGLLKAFSLAKVKTFARDDGMQSSPLPSAQAIKAVAVRAICGLVGHFPAVLLDHQWHQLIHALDYLPVQTCTMWHVEVAYRYLVQLIRNRWGKEVMR